MIEVAPIFKMKMMLNHGEISGSRSLFHNSHPHSSLALLEQLKHLHLYYMHLHLEVL